MELPHQERSFIQCPIARARRLTPVIMTSRWLFKRKADGRCKVRLVVRGFQEPGLDGTEDTYSPTPSHLTLRLALVIAASLGYDATNADFKTAFLNALIGLEECLFIHPPQGVTLDGDVLQLAKALYGLASSPLRWFMLVSRLLKSFGLRIHPDEPCLYWSTSKQLVVIYVDDCRVMGTKASITALIDFLASHYPIHSMAPDTCLMWSAKQPLPVPALYAKAMMAVRSAIRGRKRAPGQADAARTRGGRRECGHCHLRACLDSHTLAPKRKIWAK
jgi:hypothetical protein